MEKHPSINILGFTKSQLVCIKYLELHIFFTEATTV